MSLQFIQRKPTKVWKTIGQIKSCKGYIGQRFITLSISNCRVLSWKLFNENTLKIGMLSNFFVITVFIRKCDKMTWPILFGTFWEKLSQSVTKKISGIWKHLLQGVTGIVKWDRIYSKVRMVLQSVSQSRKKILSTDCWHRVKPARSRN